MFPTLGPRTLKEQSFFIYYFLHTVSFSEELSPRFEPGSTGSSGKLKTDSNCARLASSEFLIVRACTSRRRGLFDRIRRM